MSANSIRMAALLLGLTCAVNTFAAPDPAAEAGARSLLKEGNGLLDKGDYAGALARYQAAHKLFPSPKLLLNIGTALRQLGRNAEAAETYQQFMDNPAADAAYKSEVAGILRTLDQTLATLTIEVDPPDARLLVDGKSYPYAHSALVLRVERGHHAIAADKPGFGTAVASATVAAREHRTISLHLTATPTPAMTALPTASPAPAPALTEPPPVARHRIATWAVGGAGVGLLAGSLIAGLIANSRYGTLKSGCATDGTCNVATLPNAQSLIDGVHSAGLASDVLLGVGLAAVVGGVILFFVEGRHPAERHAAWRLAPSLGARGAGLAFELMP